MEDKIMEREVNVDGLRIRYLEEGSGMPVIMLHGASLGSSADVFERHLGPLSDAGFRAVAYDQPGFGLSDAAEDYTLAYRTGFLPRFMSAIDAEQAALIGHSQAGGIVVETALDHPDRVAKVLVVCSGSLLQGLPGFSPPAHAGSEDTDAPPTLEDSRKLLESNLYHKELITPEVLEKRHSLSLGRNLETFLERQRVVEPKRTGPRLWERLMEVRAPLLLLYGKQDRNQAAEKCAVLKEQMPELRLEIIDKACHMLMWDAGETYDRKAVDFLKE
jgi:pimeloyl-ACP methyl ester carboxylesterase